MGSNIAQPGSMWQQGYQQQIGPSTNDTPVAAIQHQQSQQSMGNIVQPGPMWQPGYQQQTGPNPKCYTGGSKPAAETTMRGGSGRSHFCELHWAYKGCLA